MRLGACIGVSLVGVAHAQPAPAPPDDVYPAALVDRPILLPAGVTQFDPSLQFTTYVQKIVDAQGNSTYRRTAFFAHKSVDLSVEHTWGPVEVGGAISTYDFRAFAAMSPLPHASVVAGASYADSANTPEYEVAEHVGAAYKLVVAPHRDAIVARTYVYLYEARLPVGTNTFVKGSFLQPSLHLSDEIQLTNYLSVYVGASGTANVLEPAAFKLTSGFSANGGIELTSRKWDLLIDTSVALTDHPSTFLNVGFAKRWGL